MGYGKFAGPYPWVIYDELVSSKPRPRVAAVTPTASSASLGPDASSDEEAIVRLLFEEDDALQRRVAQTLTVLFFGAEGAHGPKAKANCDALFRQMARHAAPSDEFRHLIERAFRQEISDVIGAIVADEVRAAVRKQVSEMEKYSRRMSAAPKGPRK